MGAFRRVVERSAEPRQQLDADTRPLAGGDLERPPQHGDQICLDHAGLLDVAPRNADRGPRDAVAVAKALPDRGRLLQRGRCERPLTASHPCLAQEQQQLETTFERIRLVALQHLKRARVVLSRLLVREHRGGLFARPAPVGDRFVRVLRGGRSGEVAGQSCEVVLAAS